MNIFDTIVRLVLKNRVPVLVFSALIFVYGSYVTINSPVDILPDLNRPTVTVFAEAEGLAAEEVETLVSFPIESVMNGASGVERVRSISSPGLALIFVEFDWKQDIYLARQIVSEKLNSVAVPEGVSTTLGPISSIMGEIQLVGLSSPNGGVSPGDLRSLADWTVRPKILTVPGVASATVIGGDMEQYQIQVDSVKLSNINITIAELEETLSSIAENKSGGFLSTDTTEYPIRIIGRTTDVDVLGSTVIAKRNGALIYLRDIATVQKAAQVSPRGDASINGFPGVIMSITKQPGVNTLDLTKQIDKALEDLKVSLGDNVQLHPDLFKQEKFIRNGIDNVIGATRDAAILVVIVLILFLGNARAIGITLTALPLSFIVAIIILRIFGIAINVMTLGGLAVAIGELTDDAVVGVENAIRWLKENKNRAVKLSPFEVIIRASSEVRGSVIFSTVLVVLVFMPLFALGGIEGRLLAPLGLAYIIALVASTVVAMTVTTILSYYLLPGSSMIEDGFETKFLTFVKAKAEPLIRYSIRTPKTGLIIAGSSIFLTLLLVAQAGKEFLPPFNEGTLTIGVALAPGESMEKSNALGVQIEKKLLAIEGIESVARRTGRAEEDEHAAGVNSSELEVDVDLNKRSKDDIIEDVKKAFATLPLEGANVGIGQPISHRIEHILSGVRAPIVIKLFGPDLDALQLYAGQVRDILEDIPGTLNPVVAQEVKVPQVTITPNRDLAAQYGFTFGDLTDILEITLAGEEIGTILEGSRAFDLVLRLDQNSINNPEKIGSLLIATPNGSTVPLSSVADIKVTNGRNSISHDNGQRRIVISSGILDGDSVTIIESLQKKVEAELDLPAGYFLSYEGTYKSQKESSRKLLLYTFLALLGIIASLYYKFRSFSLVTQVLINVPVTYAGAMLFVLFTGNVINLAGLVGLISILGLAARNGILLIEHWIFKATEEGEPFGEELIVSGALNRLSPMLMTSLTSMLALLPLLWNPDQPGKEILYPLAVTTFGGLLTSLFVEVLIRPGMFALFGQKPLEQAVAKFHKLDSKN
ncbi:CusA/CzcA family heavy metal efflux RND transporter [Candidatus Peregrinibacteria bacterium CG10_big_fil_rev_8_21_14_0_10_42_8]|nr:MAG: CusA/CzcA family heavy metal efflux RND transporter [Candidatus Peregrinibacteria bacterium CG10_big_fil_rev_8_21_14_0_10_42_8]